MFVLLVILTPSLNCASVLHRGCPHQPHSKGEDVGVIELQKDQEDIDMSRNDMEDKLDTVIKRVSKR